MKMQIGSMWAVSWASVDCSRSAGWQAVSDPLLWLLFLCSACPTVGGSVVGGERAFVTKWKLLSLPRKPAMPNISSCWALPGCCQKAWSQLPVGAQTSAEHCTEAVATQSQEPLAASLSFFA